MQPIDENWMDMAVQLARKGEGLTRPNPPVGAVIVRAGQIIGQGWHCRAGGAHAEVMALMQAGNRTRGATLYVTLEPCCTHGRTPPCTQAIIDAGIKKVVVAVRDPNPYHKGKGFKVLRQAGVMVVEGGAREAARELIAPFAAWVERGRPYLTLKIAESLDGRIADRCRRSRWITGTDARREVQSLRRRADAVMVGAGTVRADNPSLLPRPARGRETWRVILDSRGELSGNLAVLQPPAVARTIMAVTRACPAANRARWQTAGAQVWVLPAAAGRVSLPALLRRLGRLGLLHVVCEGGGELAAALIRARLVDEYLFFIAPRVLGGGEAPGAVGGRGWPLNQAPGLVFTECRMIGRDVMLKARPE